MGYRIGSAPKFCGNSKTWNITWHRLIWNIVSKILGAILISTLFASFMVTSLKSTACTFCHWQFVLFNLLQLFSSLSFIPDNDKHQSKLHCTLYIGASLLRRATMTYKVAFNEIVKRWYFYSLGNCRFL